MKVKRTPLLSALENMISIAGRRAQNPIYNCFLLSARNSTLTIRVTDGNEWATELVACEGDLESLCVNSRQFMSTISSASEDIEVFDNKPKMSVKSRFKADLSIIEADTFPALSKQKLHPQGINCRDLADGIDRVSWATSTALDRPTLCGVHIKCDEQHIVCQGTIGFQVADYRKSAISSKFDIIVPNEFVDGLVAALRRDGAELLASNEGIAVLHSSGEWSGKVMEGKYPDVERVLGFDRIELGEIEVKSMVSALQMVDTLGDDPKCNAIKLDFSEKGIDLYFKCRISKFEETITGQFPVYTSRTSQQSIAKCLSVVKSEKVKLSAFRAGASKGLVIVDGDLTILATDLTDVMVKSKEEAEKPSAPV